MATLPEVRDLLLPELQKICSKYGSDYESDIQVDFNYDALIVRVFRFSTRQELGFAILRSHIEDNTHISNFISNCTHVFECLKMGAGAGIYGTNIPSQDQTTTSIQHPATFDEVLDRVFKSKEETKPTPEQEAERMWNLVREVSRG